MAETKQVEQTQPFISGGQLGKVFSASDIVNVVKQRIEERERVKFYKAVISAIIQQGEKLQADVQNQLLELNKRLDKIQEDANILKDIELGQVEEAIKKTLEKIDTQELFSTLCINVNGKTVKLHDFIQKLFEFSIYEPVEKEFKEDTSGNIIAQFKLVNGKVVVIPTSVKETYKQIDENTQLLDEVEITGETDQWIDGMNIGFKSVLKAFYEERTLPDGTKSYELRELREVYRKDFFVKVDIQPCTPLTPETATPDLNKDGKIGT